MAHQRHPLATVVDACTPLRFAPLPQIRTPEVLRLDGRTDTEHWYRADLLAANGVLGPVYDGFVAGHGPGHRLPAATHLLRALLREPIFMVAAGVYLTGRAPLPAADGLWFPARADRGFGTPMVTSPRVAVLPGDVFADHPDAVVAADPDDLDRMAAEAMLDAFAPLIGAVHAHTRLGLRTLWGWVLDTMHFHMLNPARFLGRDVSAAWERADRLAEALVSAGAVTRARPRLFPFSEDHPRGTWAVRGTCCFDYKGDPEHGYCTTCPLKCDSQRRGELQEWLRNPALAP
ncbi:(2Fe-2S)-binding protein [Actinorugispora endophytica]|uniref:FhuF-like iron-sulfur protein n=1 Tax=Actinorugispora endophytica TaxID=1605990 RepID=A0A4R6UGG5_9ACTN|nr:(2Fe-2S)-binding protein [Actinorugispora endophytica]TDQ45878.1 FhuF-like iron-sulfur protein [Actinorugispora endophytica]